MNASAVTSPQESSSAKIWLVGGGLEEPWSYGELESIKASTLGPRGKMGSVAEVLIGLSRACSGGDVFAPEDISFEGEGRLALRRPDRVLASGSLASFCDAEIVLATSGSMGVPRMVRHRLTHLMRSVVTGSRHANDVWGLAFNSTHIAGVQVFLQAFANHNTMVNLWGIAPREAFERCRKWNVTHLSATPTFYRLLLSVPGVLPALRSVTLGGEAADAGLVARLRERFPRARLHDIYASTEAGTLLQSDGEGFMIPESAASTLRIADGRLWVHCSLLGKFDGAGEWHDTGDFVEFTAEGSRRFRITGRAKAWVNVGGEKVNPVEVEAILASHPAIAAARVSGGRNSVLGEILVADVVVRESSVDEADLRADLSRQLPPHKIPRIFRFVERLEVSRTGKLKRDV